MRPEKTKKIDEDEEPTSNTKQPQKVSDGADIDKKFLDKLNSNNPTFSKNLKRHLDDSTLEVLEEKQEDIIEEYSN